MSEREKMIKYIIEAKLWRDKINGNTYHAVNITDTATNKLIFSSGLTYGYGDHYRQTAITGLIRLGLFKEEDRTNHELKREILYFSVQENCLKKELKKIEVGV